MDTPVLTLTSSAGLKIASLLLSAPDNPHFRVQIAPGGCSGFQYRFGVDSEVKKRDIQQHIQNPIFPFTLLVDRISAQYLKNAKIDYCKDANGGRFVVDNPGAEMTCSCGSSFTPPEK
jgi:iron-sulfur cluster insertion protein